MSLWMLYSFALLLALLLGSPFLLLRMVTTGKYRDGLSQRLGFVPQALRNAAHGRRTIWLHAVSVGEIIAAGRLVAELESALPDHRICISATTRTGYTLAQQRFGPLDGNARVFYFPLDFAFIVKRYLRALQPEMLILMETELWPNVLLQCAKRSIPVAVVNARISDRSLPRYRRLRLLWRPLLAKVALFCAQSDVDADRLRGIGAPPDRVRMLGNLKFDVRAGEQSALVTALRAQLPAGTKILICGSTLDGEEAALLDCLPALGPEIFTILAPRHPERFSAVAQLLQQRGIAFTRRSQWQTTPLAPGSVFLLDSVGDLASLYAMADVAFVGGSLIPAGGHNPLEPAQFGVPVVMGESFENFRGIVSAMRAARGIEIVSRAALCSTLTALFADPQRAQAIGEAGKTIFHAESGATARTVAALLPLLRRQA